MSSGRPTPMTATVARLIGRLTTKHGRVPSDAELAALLAIHPSRVAHHRRLIDRS